MLKLSCVADQSDPSIAIVRPTESDFNGSDVLTGQSALNAGYMYAGGPSETHSTLPLTKEQAHAKIAEYHAFITEIQKTAGQLYQDAYHCDAQTAKWMYQRADLLCSWAALLFSIPEVEQDNARKIRFNLIMLGY